MQASDSKKLIVEITGDWQDLGRQFKKGDWFEVYDTPEWNDFYYLCRWGQWLFSKDHCKVIKGDLMKFTIKEKASGNKFCTPEEIADSFKGLEAADQESFWLLGFDSKNKEILRECLFLGGLSCCSIDPRVIFKRLLVKNCVSFIIVHNHPSGDPAPSHVDLKITDQIKQIAKILDLRLMDSIVIGEKRFVSFVRDNLF